MPDPFRRAARLGAVELSEILRITELATALRAAGRDVIGFGAGEPDFPTPPHVIAAAHAAMLAGETRYAPTQGTPALRDAIAAGCGLGERPGREQIIVSAGAKQVIFNALMATLDPGDEVAIATPWWTSYPDMVAVCGGRAVPVPTLPEEGFRLRPEALAAAIGPRTRWVLLNSPSNPAGAVLGPGDMAALAEVRRGAPHVGIISDDIYRHICHVPFASFAAVAPDLAARTLTVDGVSKSHAMTGWRIGWGIGPAPLIAAMVAVQGQATSGACSVSQAAAVAALTGPQDLLVERREAFRARRDAVVAALNLPGRLRLAPPEGAFYAFVDCRQSLGLRTPAGTVLADDAAFCEELLRQAGVAVVPGRAFGQAGHFRLSFACDEADLRRGCAAIAAFCQTLH